MASKDVRMELNLEEAANHKYRYARLSYCALLAEAARHGQYDEQYEEFCAKYVRITYTNT